MYNVIYDTFVGCFYIHLHILSTFLPSTHINGYFSIILCFDIEYPSLPLMESGLRQVALVQVVLVHVTDSWQVHLNPGVVEPSVSSQRPPPHGLPEQAVKGEANKQSCKRLLLSVMICNCYIEVMKK